MASDLKSDIARIVHWKQVAAGHDKLHALKWHLPCVGATVEQIARAERLTGTTFSEDYKEFLSCADGWNGFYILVDLFGTRDFSAGRATDIMKRPELRKFFQDEGWINQNVVPIGGSDAELDVFLLMSPTSPVLPGGVVWWANEEIDRYPSFRDFFGAMVNYNAQVAHKIAQQR